MILHILCGIPGSGKTTVAKRLPGYVVSTDSIRKYLWGDEAVVKHDKLVFQLAEAIIDYLLGRGEDTVFDATNLTTVKRARFINIAKKHKATVVLHWIQCSLPAALQRNARRERRVQERVIKALFKSFQTPFFAEGIDIINIYGESLDLLKTETAPPKK